MYNLRVSILKTKMQFISNDCYKNSATNGACAHRITDDRQKCSDEENTELCQKARSKRMRLAACVQNLLCSLPNIHVILYNFVLLCKLLFCVVVF